ncbi:sigma 54-interacting transcriptional regulator [Magnetovibrio sp. PR-2]|uniref:sigma-54 interaction domain-containing protein n=1 Tax=Magnetovibrio sp. PR-2 TaxID=3120356 RepID=UPI002FCDF436
MTEFTATTSPPETGELLSAISEPAALLTPEYRIVAANEAYHALYGDNVIGRFCYEVSHHFNTPCDRAGESCPLDGTCASNTKKRVLHLHHTEHGEEHVDVETHPVHDEHGNITHVVEIMRHSTIASATPEAQGLIGRSQAFSRMLDLVQRVAPTDATALLLGETGVGKEMVAQAVHQASERHDKPFVPVECSGLTESLFESELFGHEKGAFTGALAQKRGLVEAASGGTLFLDEIGDIPLPMQVKLLRLLETSTFRRVGSTEPRQAKFRLICATHRNLKDMVKDGRFREDLYFRINIFPILLPSLRERVDDLAVLIPSIWQRVAPGQELSIDDDARRMLYAYAYPGNIRELRNILERAALLADGNPITPDCLPMEMVLQSGNGLDFETELSEPLVTLEEAEQRYLKNALARFKGTRKELADKLGLSERKLYRKIQALNTD